MQKITPKINKFKFWVPCLPQTIQKRSRFPKETTPFIINNGYYILIIDSSQLAFFSTPSKSATVAAILESPKEPSLTV